MMYRNRNWVGGLAALTLLIILPATALAAGTVLHADLIGSNAVSSGTVDYQANHQETQAKLRINLQGVQNATTVIVVIQGTPVGSITLDDNGDGSLHLSTRRGDQVPILQAGEVVDIYGANAGNVLLKGILMRAQ